MHLSWTILFCLLINSLAAQQESDSTVILIDPVYVKAEPHQFSEGLSKKVFDAQTLKNYQHQSLATLLQEASSAFIKQYGVGLLATASVRGGGAHHTSVLWEGINIQNPMLGQSDLSLLPIAFANKISFTQGGQAALTGSNAMGGVIELSSSLTAQQPLALQANLQVGSFKQFQQQVAFQVKHKKYRGSLKSFYKRAQNDFKYRDLNAFGNPKPLVKQQNADQEAWGILQENQLQVGSHRFSAKSWFQHNFRELPPNLLQLQGDNERQWDRAWRNVLNWRYAGVASIWEAQTALIWEDLVYQSNVVNSASQTWTSQTKIQQKKYLNFRKPDGDIFQWGLVHAYQTAFSTNFSSPPQEHRLAAFAAYQLRFKKTLLVNASFRQQWVAGNWLRPAAGLNLEWRLLKKGRHLLKLQASTAHNYRFPTFNDRYWPASGNPELAPEYSFGNDAKLRWKQQWNEHWSLRLEAGGYSNWVRNWIIWLPDEQSSLWRPENLPLVWTRGLESEFLLAFEQGVWQLNWGASHQYNRAERLLAADPELRHKQLIYTPRQQVNSWLSLQFKKLNLTYQHSYTSPRFLDNYNVNVLPAYQLGSLRAGFSWAAKKLEYGLQARIENLWNQDYQVVANRVMPRRAFYLSFGVDF